MLHPVRRPRYNLPLRLTGWILRGIFLFMLIFLPTYLLLSTFQIAIPLGWLPTLLGRLLLIAAASFLLGGFSSAFLGK